MKSVKNSKREMTELEDLNIEWTGICTLMQLLNDQRIQTYKRWRAEMERQGHEFGPDFPLEMDMQPSFYVNLKGQSIRINGEETRNL